MNDDLIRVLAKLGLSWDEDDLMHQLRPYALGELTGEGDLASVFAAQEPDSSQWDLVIKVPRVPSPDEAFVMNWDICLRALQHEDEVLRKCAGIVGSVRLAAITCSRIS